MTPQWMADLQPRLRLPLIAAPMFLVSGVDLVSAACAAGVVGAFPTDVWSAGHSVSGVQALLSVAELVDQTEAQYRQARTEFAARLAVV